MYRKMLVANDGSAGGAKALAGALELARRLDVGLTMICVEELPRFPTSIGEIDEAQASYSKRISSLGIPCRESSNSFSAAGMIYWSSATWATRRYTIDSSAARRIGSSSLCLAK